MAFVSTGCFFMPFGQAMVITATSTIPPTALAVQPILEEDKKNTLKMKIIIISGTYLPFLEYFCRYNGLLHGNTLTAINDREPIYDTPT